MTEPVVPVINPAILKAKPKPSGICPDNTKLLLLLAVPFAGIVIGIVAHFVGIIVGYIGAFVAAVPNLLAGVCGWILCFGVVWAAIVLLCVVFGYPFLVGMGIGQFVYWIGKKGNCRSPMVAGASGFLTGLFAYAGHLGMAYLLNKGFHILTVSTNSLEDLFGSTIIGTPWWMYVLMVIELVLVVIGAASQANSETENDLFCEMHGVWYAPWKEALYSVDIAPAIAETFEAAQVRNLENVRFLDAVTYPHLKIRSRRCPSSAACELQFKVELNWQDEKVNKKGEKSQENKVKVWVDTMVIPSLGFALETALRLDDAKVAKTQKSKKTK